MSVPTYLELLDTRTVVFDGAMGTSIQSRSPSVGDFGGERLEGCNDHLVLSAPDSSPSIHASFLEVGCDVVETNTFRANRFALREYGLQTSRCRHQRGGGEARERSGFQLLTRIGTQVRGWKHRTVRVPAQQLRSGLGRITYEELVDGYQEQAEALLRGGVDLLLMETGQDILEVKAAVTGARRAMASGRPHRPSSGPGHPGHHRAHAPGHRYAPRPW